MVPGEEFTCNKDFIAGTGKINLIATVLLISLRRDFYWMFQKKNTPALII